MASDGGCKVERIAERYDLEIVREGTETLDEYLLARWTGRDERSPEGYRPLATWFNKRLLKRVYDGHGREIVGLRLDGDYDALTGEDELVKQETMDALEDDGIDATALLDDMISWSTLRHHLKDCLDGEKPRPSAETAWERESVRIARERTAGKVAEALRSLESKGDLPAASAAGIDVQIQLSCPDCPVRVPMSEAVSRGYICPDHR